MELFDKISGLAIRIVAVKNQYGRGWKHVAPDGSGWVDFKFKNGKVKRTVIKGYLYGDLKSTINRIMERNQMT